MASVGPRKVCAPPTCELMSLTAEFWLVVRSSTRLETKNDGMHMISARKQTMMSLRPMDSLKLKEREAVRIWSGVGSSIGYPRLRIDFAMQSNDTQGPVKRFHGFAPLLCNAKYTLRAGVSSRTPLRSSRQVTGKSHAVWQNPPGD